MVPLITDANTLLNIINSKQNDEDFLKQAGYKIAVGNAEDKLKQISTYTCENNFGDGVAEAIEKFAL